MIPANAAVLVTGGAGFIGSHLVEHLVSSGGRVTVVDNLATGSLGNLAGVRSHVEVIVGDMGDLLQRQQIRVDAYDYIFHLAANPYIPPSVERPAYDFALNLQNTFTLLEALRAAPHPPRLVNTSSAAVYGNPATLPIKETDPTVPISPYGVSKLAAERYVAVYSQLYGIPATSVRLFSVFGPRQRKQVIYDLLRKLRANPQSLEVLGDGSQARDFVYATDVAQAMCLAATVAPGRGEVYNVASGATHTIADVVDTWCRICKTTPNISYSGRVRPGDAEKWEVDISALKALGFVPRVSTKAGLASIQEWYDGNRL